MNEQEDSSLSPFTIIFLICLVAVAALLLLPYFQGGGLYSASHLTCKNRLRQFGTYLTLYKINRKIGAYPPMSGGGIANNWGDFLRRVRIDGKRWKNIPDKLYVCPVRDKNKPGPKTNEFWWADEENVRYFPVGAFSQKLDSNTPIAGDAPGNHDDPEDEIRHVLLFEGTIKEVEPGDDLWEKAYGENGALAPAGNK